MAGPNRQKVTRQKVSAAYIQHTLHVQSWYTAGALQFKLGPYKGRWAHFNIKLHFYMMAYGLPINEDEWGADICGHPPLLFRSKCQHTSLHFTGNPQASIKKYSAAVQVEERFLHM